MEYVKHLLYNFFKKNLFFLRLFFFSEIYSLYHSGFNTYTVFAGKQLVAPVFLHKKPTNLQRYINLRHGGKINHNTRLPINNHISV